MHDRRPDQIIIHSPIDYPKQMMAFQEEPSSEFLNGDFFTLKNPPG
ncbi:hypothetical protein [Methanobrevibacter sp.]